MLARRTLLAAGPLSFVARAPPGWVLIPVPDDRVILAETAGPTRLLLPGARCGILGAFPLGPRACAAIRFAAPGVADMDLLAVAGGGRVLLLEPWSGRAPDGAHLATRLDALPDGRTLALRRDAAAPHRSATVWARQSWTDFVTSDVIGLVDAPIRPPLAGTWQASLASRRALVLAGLRLHPSGALDPAVLRTVSVWPWDQAAS